MTDDTGQHGNAHGTSGRDARRDALAGEIAARLRHVCQHLSEAEFAHLVADIATTRLRFDAIDAARLPGASTARDRRTEREGRADDAAP